MDWFNIFGLIFISAIMIPNIIIALKPQAIYFYRARYIYADDSVGGELAIKQSRALVSTFKKMKEEPCNCQLTHFQV